MTEEVREPREEAPKDQLCDTHRETEVEEERLKLLPLPRSLFSGFIRKRREEEGVVVLGQQQLPLMAQAGGESEEKGFSSLAAAERTRVSLFVTRSKSSVSALLLLLFLSLRSSRRWVFPYPLLYTVVSSSLPFSTSSSLLYNKPFELPGLMANPNNLFLYFFLSSSRAV